MPGHDEIRGIVSNLSHLAEVWGQAYISEDSEKASR